MLPQNGLLVSLRSRLCNSVMTYPRSFLGKSGQLYVLRNEGLALEHVKPLYARRESVEQYNSRTGHPEYVDADEAMKDFDREVTIDPITLTVHIGE